MYKKTALFILALVAVLAACSRTEEAKAPAPDCDINAGPCVRQAPDGLTVTFEIYPRPVRSMQDVSFGVLLERGGAPMDDAEVTVDFTMPGMKMGRNFHILKHIGDGVYRSEGVLPRCPKGEKLWQSEVMIQTPGKGPMSVSYLFEVD